LCGTLRLSDPAQLSVPQSTPPTFRSAVDLVTIEASVRDKRGVPIPDLQASDFIVTIDGRPRKVVSTQFFKTEVSGARLTAGGPPTPRHLTNDAATPGRVVVFAVDGESIQRGHERALFETASRMLDALAPADAVGLIEMPSGTPWVNPADGAIVRTRLELDGFRGSGSHAAIDVFYRNDPVLAMWVPARMQEKYSGGSAATATTVATYKDFKRFQTSVKIK
jgi:hypothetical protein